MNNKVVIRRLSTGLPGLDAILGGGLPEFSFNLIVGSPGSGKTTLAHQIMFSLVSEDKPALFFTAFGEPPLKMLRYQQQFSFFDFAQLDKKIRYVNLGDDIASGHFEQVLKRVEHEVDAFGASLVFIDSFFALMREIPTNIDGDLSPQQLLQQLGIQLTSSQATTFLIGEYLAERQPNPILTVADGILLLEQSVHRNSMVRNIQVLKMRGQSPRPGVHPFRITGEGLQVFPSALIRDDSSIQAAEAPAADTGNRLAFGIPELDAMLGGGLPAGYSLLVAGPSGSGKTILATAFLAEGARCGEAGIIVAFEQAHSRSLDRTIDNLMRAGKIGLINTRSPDLSIDEIVLQLTNLIRATQARRVVIDSLSGFELAVAPRFREDFRESLFRMVAVLSDLGVTLLITSELEDRYTDLRFSPYGSAFLTDAIIVQRYIEVESSLKRVMAVVKVRGSDHSKEIREFSIGDGGIVIGDPVFEFEGLFSGQPTRTEFPAAT
jgi:circadian clock protein KaiC